MLRWFCAAALVVAIGCSKKAEISDAPDLSSLALKYDQPDGVVDAATVTASFAEAVRIANVATESGLGPFLRDAFDRLRDRAAGDRLNRDGVGLDMSIELRRVCNGWMDPSAPANPAQNGVLDMQGVVRSDGTLPTAWGNTVGPCRETRTIEGRKMRLVLEGAVTTYGSSIDLPLLVRLSGRFGSDMAIVVGAGDLRVMPNGQLEIRMPARTGGSVVFLVGADEAFVRGSNGRFLCVEATHNCTGPNGDAFRW